MKLSLLPKILRELGHRKNVVVLVTNAEDTTGQTADFLKVSRSYLLKFLEEGKSTFA